MRDLIERVGSRLSRTAPPAAVDFAYAARLSLTPGRRRRLLKEAEHCRSCQDWFAFAQRNLKPGPVQSEAESLEFIAYAASFAPLRVCEIGTQFGGNSLLLARALTTVEHLIGVDLHVLNKATLRHVARAGQRLDYIDGSSSDPSIRAKVEELLNGELLDLLFIDGDHRFPGVRADFLGYRNLVRDGGLIVFHDIVPDGRERGVETFAFSGGVPAIWKLVRDLYPSREIVGDPDSQLGCGIGVITYSPSVVVAESDLCEDRVQSS